MLQNLDYIRGVQKCTLSSSMPVYTAAEPNMGKMSKPCQLHDAVLSLQRKWTNIMYHRPCSELPLTIRDVLVNYTTRTNIGYVCITYL